MDRPYVICHMLTSLDGKVTGEFLGSDACDAATEIYYDIHRETRSDGFICGRVTMETVFTDGWYPDLSKYQPPAHASWRPDCIFDDQCGFYAIAFDTHGKLGWRSSTLVDPDDDPGYNGAHIVEVLSENVDERYLGYLVETGISYVFAGKETIDVELALSKLQDRLSIDTLLLEGGSVLNGAFLRAGVVDEVSVVVAPVTAEKDDKPLFADSISTEFELTEVRQKNGCPILNYKRR